ncbi:MAG: hypothetical protein FD136_1186 [Chitinophagaceae bacterium]|nr:MAG: hypothetical protein FD136_1186 [Chitinophagaceae bacterium]
MRIAFFVQYCHEAGTYFRWHNLAKALVLSGHEVDVYAGDFNYKAKKRIEYRDNIRYIITPSLISSRIFGNPSDPFTALYRSIQKIEGVYDAYHLFQPFLQAFIPWYFLKLRRKGLYIYDWDDLWVGGIFINPVSLRDKYTHKLVQILETKIPLIANFTTVCSTFLQKRLKEHSKSTILYNGFWQTNSINFKDIHEYYKKESGLFYVGYIGKTAAELDWIIDAAKIVEKQYVQVKFIIVGPAKEQIEQSGLLSIPNMIYLGEVNSTQARYIASTLDLGLLPLEDSFFNRSRFPIKFFDYLTAGIPVFYSGVGELKVIGESLSFVFEGGVNKDTWIMNLIDLLGDMINKPPIAINIEGLAEKYSWISIAQSLENIYKVNSRNA